MSPRRRPTRERAKPPSPSRATWMAARARNALRRPVFIGAVSIMTFIASLVALVVVPQQARRAAAQLRPVARTASRHRADSRALSPRPSDRFARPTRRSLAARNQISQLVSRGRGEQSGFARRRWRPHRLDAQPPRLARGADRAARPTARSRRQRAAARVVPRARRGSGDARGRAASGNCSTHSSRSNASARATTPSAASIRCSSR